jgi:hypothetical protein
MVLAFRVIKELGPIWLGWPAIASLRHIRIMQVLNSITESASRLAKVFESIWLKQQNILRRLLINAVPRLS